MDFNPAEGLRIKEGSIQSAALGLGHEIGHAARALSDPEGYKADNEQTQGSGIIESGEFRIHYPPTTEEIRVREGVETEMATELGEPTRSSDDSGVRVTVSDPIHSCTADPEKSCP